MEESVCVHFSFVWFVYVPMIYIYIYIYIYIFHTYVARYSLFVMKVPLNTNKTKKRSKTVLGDPVKPVDFLSP